MALLRTYKFRVKDSTSGKHLDAAAKAVNEVWNHCNAMQRHALKNDQKWPDVWAFQASTKGASKLLGIPAQTVQGVCEEYRSRRWSNKLSKLRWRGERSLGWVPFKNQTLRIDGSSVWFKSRQIRLWMHRPIEGRIKAGSFSQDARRRWYCNIVVEYEPAKAQQRDGAVGIDLGLKNVATLSSGEIISHPRVYRDLEQKLSMAFRARKTRMSRTINVRIANIRKDFLHKTTTRIADCYGALFVGDVSARWQQQFNGKTACDASMATFRNMLRYKAIARSAVYVDVPEAYTTQTCSSCGSLPPERPRGIAGLGIREWTCGCCGADHDRDVNAALNILRLGRQALAEGASVTRGDVTGGFGASGNAMRA